MNKMAEAQGQRQESSEGTRTRRLYCLITAQKLQMGQICSGFSYPIHWKRQMKQIDKVTNQ